MIAIPIQKLEITNEDGSTIKELYTAKKREEGYEGPVFISAPRLYAIHGSDAMQITRSWLRILVNNSNPNNKRV